MSFNPEPSISPSRIPRLVLHFAIDRDDLGATVYTSLAELAILMTNGSKRDRNFTHDQLMLHLTASEKAGIRALLDRLMLKAETEIL